MFLAIVMAVVCLAIFCIDGYFRLDAIRQAKDLAKVREWEKLYSDPEWRKNNPFKAAAVEKQRKIDEAERKQRQEEAKIKKHRADLLAKGVVSCPKCGSTAITSVRSGPDTFAVGYSAARELTGGCTVINVCQACSCRFYPGV